MTLMDIVGLTLAVSVTASAALWFLVIAPFFGLFFIGLFEIIASVISGPLAIVGGWFYEENNMLGMEEGWRRNLRIRRRVRRIPHYATRVQFSRPALK